MVRQSQQRQASSVPESANASQGVPESQQESPRSPEQTQSQCQSPSSQPYGSQQLPIELDSDAEDDAPLTHSVPPSSTLPLVSPKPKTVAPEAPIEVVAPIEVASSSLQLAHKANLIPSAEQPNQIRALLAQPKINADSIHCSGTQSGQKHSQPALMGQPATTVVPVSSATLSGFRHPLPPKPTLMRPGPDTSSAPLSHKRAHGELQESSQGSCSKKGKPNNQGTRLQREEPTARERAQELWDQAERDAQDMAAVMLVRSLEQGFGRSRVNPFGSMWTASEGQAYFESDVPIALRVGLHVDAVLRLASAQCPSLTVAQMRNVRSAVSALEIYVDRKGGPSGDQYRWRVRNGQFGGRWPLE
jgi:hypothetical protein